MSSVILQLKEHALYYVFMRRMTIRVSPVERWPSSLPVQSPASVFSGSDFRFCSSGFL